MTMEDIASGSHPPAQASPMQMQAPDMFSFLHKYRQLNDNIEYSVTK
jgi:hypothetical protein